MSGKKGYTINPLTGRKIKIGGPTYKKLQQRGGGVAEEIQQKSDQLYNELLKKSLVSTGKPIPSKLAATGEGETAIIPKDKHHLIPSNLPPAPNGSHSYYHHHAPFSQDFGDYVCIKKDTMRDLATFLRDTMFTSVKT